MEINLSMRLGLSKEKQKLQSEQLDLDKKPSYEN